MCIKILIKIFGLLQKASSIHLSRYMGKQLKTARIREILESCGVSTRRFACKCGCTSHALANVATLLTGVEEEKG
ncbi:hypothetical protein L1887_22757 [Cichorium endivia]|nr:hypothetical protein L1887_22757 [Cichorium endivia]